MANMITRRTFNRSIMAAATSVVLPFLPVLPSIVTQANAGVSQSKFRVQYSPTPEEVCALSDSVRRRLWDISYARRCLLVDDIPQGIITPRYGLDDSNDEIFNVARVYGKPNIYSSTVKIETVKGAIGSIPLDIFQHVTGLVECDGSPTSLTVNTIAEQVEAYEESVFDQMLMYLGQGCPTVKRIAGVSAVSRPFLNLVSTAFRQLEGPHDLIVGNVVAHESFKPLLLDAGLLDGDEEKGYYFWTANVHFTKNEKMRRWMYCMARPDELGALAVVSDVCCVLHNDPVKRGIRAFRAFCDYGWGILNTTFVSRAYWD